MELLEREDELAAVSEVIAGAAAGSGRFVAIEGVAGIGKTQLVASARRQAADSGLRVLAARGSELERDFAYGLVRQLLEPVIARADADQRARLLSGAAAHAEPLFSGVHPAAGAGTDDAAFALLHGLYWVTVNAADQSPLLIAIDDLHWADAASLRWLAYVAHRIDGVAVAAIAATRSAGADADAAFADLLTDPLTVVVRPQPLSAAATARLAAARLEHAQAGVLGEALHEATGGNPLLLRELLAALAHEPPADDARAMADHARRLAPQVVARRVGFELAKLGRQAAALASATAVLGDDVDFAQATELAGLDGPVAEAEAARLARAEILKPGWPLRFGHPLLRAAVYEGMPPGDRARLHAEAAALLSDAGASHERVAAQLLRAAPGTAAGAVDRLRAAAAEALATGASGSAVAYLRRAIREPVDDRLRAELLLSLADAEGRLGAAETVEHLQEALSLLDDPARRARVRVDLARALFWREREEEALLAIDEAGRETFDERLLGELEVERLSAALRIPGRHREAFERLDLLTPSAADEAGRALCALKAYGLAVRGVGRDEAVALARQALADGLPAADTPTWAYWGAVSTLLLADELDSAISVTSEALAGARRRGAVYLYSGASMVRASLLRARGELVEAEADARAAVDALPNRGVMIMPLAYGELAAVLVERGLLAEAEESLREAGADGPLPVRFGTINLLRARSALRLAQGDAPGAVADARACGEAFAAVGFENPAAAHWRSEAALAHLMRGEAEDARALASEEVELARRWGAPRAIARALRTLGLAEGRDGGVATLAEALDMLDGSPARLERARTLVELGAALRRALKRVEARERLRAGLELAARCGATSLAERAREELVAAGARPRSTAMSGVDSLTASERRVANMAAEGMSNREIAQALFVTGRTVEMHLSNAFRKLDIGSRTQLAEELAAGGARGAALVD